MKKETHPDYHEISVEMTDGKTYKTRSTWGKAGDTLKLEIDPLTHPAWSKGTRKLVDTGGRLARFRQRFSGFGMDAPEGKAPESKAPESKAPESNAPESNAPEGNAAKESPAPVEAKAKTETKTEAKSTKKAKDSADESKAPVEP